MGTVDWDAVGIPLPPAVPGSAGVTLLGEAVALLRSEWSDIVSDTARLTSLRALWPQVCALNAHVAQRIGDIHVAGAGVGDGFASTAAFLRKRLCMDGPSAARWIRVGFGLRDLPLTLGALDEGLLSVEHADAVRSVAHDLGTDAMADGELERILVDYAMRKPPAEVRRLGRLIRAHLMSDEDAEQRQVRMYEGRWLTVATTVHGMVHIEGMLDPVAGAALLAALAAYTPGPDRDHARTPGQRRADGFEDIIGVALANKDRSVTGDEKPHVTVTVSFETLLHRHHAATTPQTGTGDANAGEGATNAGTGSAGAGMNESTQSRAEGGPAGGQPDTDGHGAQPDPTRPTSDNAEADASQPTTASAPVARIDSQGEHSESGGPSNSETHAGTPDSGPDSGPDSIGDDAGSGDSNETADGEAGLTVSAPAGSEEDEPDLAPDHHPEAGDDVVIPNSLDGADLTEPADQNADETPDTRRSQRTEEANSSHTAGGTGRGAAEATVPDSRVPEPTGRNGYKSASTEHPHWTVDTLGDAGRAIATFTDTGPPTTQQPDTNPPSRSRMWIPAHDHGEKEVTGDPEITAITNQQLTSGNAPPRHDPNNDDYGPWDIAVARRRAELDTRPPRTTTPAAEARAYLTNYLRPGGMPMLATTGEPISPETARRISCDAKIIPVVLGGRSEPLDIGRASRTIPLPMRRAIELRDGHCKFPGCERPPKWCEGHHIKWWVRDNGPTEINNMILLCRFHHVLVHEYGWTLSFDPATGTVSVIRPDGTPYDLVSTRDGWTG